MINGFIIGSHSNHIQLHPFYFLFYICLLFQHTSMRAWSKKCYRYINCIIIPQPENGIYWKKYIYIMCLYIFMYEETNSQMICKPQSIRQFQVKFLCFHSKCFFMFVHFIKSFFSFLCAPLLLLLFPNTLEMRFCSCCLFGYLLF